MFFSCARKINRFYSPPHPVIPRRVAFHRRPLLFHGTARLSQGRLDLSRLDRMAFSPYRQAHD